MYHPPSPFITLRRKETNSCPCRSPLVLTTQVPPPYTSISTGYCLCLPYAIPFCSLPLTCWQVDFINVRIGWRFQMWVLETPSSSQQTQLSQFQTRLMLYQTVFLPSENNHRLFTGYTKNVTLNEDKRCAGSVIAVWAFLLEKSSF